LSGKMCQVEQRKHFLGGVEKRSWNLDWQHQSK
jgi:hypothetical protein